MLHNALNGQRRIHVTSYGRVCSLAHSARFSLIGDNFFKKLVIFFISLIILVVLLFGVDKNAEK